MTTRPTASPLFATDATFTAGDESGLAPRLDPGAGFRAQGVYPNRRMPGRWFNFLRGIVGDWAQYLSEKTDATFSPLNFAGTGDGAVDDTTPLNNCFTAAQAVTAQGRIVEVDLGGKSWRITGALNCRSFAKVKNGKILVDHASANTLSFQGDSNVSVRCEWENVEIDFLQANTGTIVHNTAAGVRAKFTNCRFNASALCTGRLFNSTSNSDFLFEDCGGKIPLNQPGFRSDLGVMEILRGKYSTPVGYADSVVTGTAGVHRLNDVHWDLSATTTGTAAVYLLAGADAYIDGCHFDDGVGHGNTAIKSTLAANTGKLVELPNRYTNITPYALTNYLELGSSLTLVPHGAGSSGAAGATIPALYRAFSQRFTTATTTPPNITFDPPLFAGQRMAFLLGNDHTSGWTGDIVLTGVQYDDSDDALTDLGPNSSAFFCAELVARRYEGSLFWVVEHMNQVVVV